MDLNKSSLTEFELERILNKYIPPAESLSFFYIGDGEIELDCLRDNINDCRFDLYISKGKVNSGQGDFVISGDIVDSDHPYHSLTVESNTSLSVDETLIVSKGNMEVSGYVTIVDSAKINIRDNGSIVFDHESVLNVENNSSIIIESGSTLMIYGTVNIPLHMVNDFLSMEGLYIDTAAVINVDGLESLGERLKSMSDYVVQLRGKIINKFTQGEENFEYGRLGYTWVAGNPLEHSQLVKLSVLWGEVPIGDFKLSCLGTANNIASNLQCVTDIEVCKNCTLHISDKFKDSNYIKPELYIGIIIDNNVIPATCTVEGTIIVESKYAKLTIDRGGSLYIKETGKVYIRNGATIQSTNNDNKSVLFIDGELIIDDISQLNTFNADNIVFGKNGKITILNPSTDERRVLFSVPRGIQTSKLYQLFKDRIDHVEFHVTENTGISIDQFYMNYSKEMKDWYGGRRIEQAILDKILIWHDGAFIELNNNVIPWANTTSNLFHASQLFKSSHSDEHERLQEVVDHLVYAGSGNMRFIFIQGSNEHDVIMTLKKSVMKSIVHNPSSDKYNMITSNGGKLFLRNEITDPSRETIINSSSTQVDSNEENTCEFILKT